MTKRIYRAILLVAMIVFLATMTLVTFVLTRYAAQEQLSQLSTALELAAQGVHSQQEAYFDALQLSQYRITWVTSDGTVLRDTQIPTEQLPNHLHRPEISQALSSGWGQSVRHSDSILEDTCYVAKRLPDGSVLRLSARQASFVSIGIKMLLPTSALFLLIALLAALLAWQLSKKVVLPLNRLDLDRPLSNQDYKELTPLFQRMDQQQRQLHAHRAELLRMQQEFDTVTSGMHEGLVLLNNRGQILGLNQAAAALLGIDKSHLGQDISGVSQQLKLEALLLDALSGKWSETTVSLAGGHYQVDASPVFDNGCLSGVVLLLLDITQKRQAESLRREFTANVSHELKIPLQTISGYAELMAGGIVKQADMQPFSQKIYDEAQQMIRLVADILSLSRLDEGAQDMPREQVDLYALAAESLSDLQAKAQNMDLTLTLAGESTCVMGIRQLLSAVIHNLCDNAIKYNRPGGSVTVTVQKLPAAAQICVEDTGIGIPESLQERIFERFFRADKSHSKKIEGTGLGLSIVKHAVAIHAGHIQVDSVPDKGTAIVVHLPDFT